jgi:hypothetical protein
VGQTRVVRLCYTVPALADLNAILDYIDAHSPQGARRVQARIQAPPPQVAKVIGNDAQPQEHFIGAKAGSMKAAPSRPPVCLL